MRCLIVGSGPVGALAAIYAARKGWDVRIYELRGDPSEEATTPLNFTKSINLALSERGISAIRQSGSPALLQSILSETIPMHGRMIHGQDSNGELTEEEQQYDIHGRSIQAVDRANLNKTLLDELRDLPNVKLFFNHKLTGADLRARKAWFEQTNSSSGNDSKRAREIQVEFDLIIGCDGAHSAVRYNLMKYVRMNYQQNYIDTLWCEFTIGAVSSATQEKISPSASAGFATSPNHLHIWPSKDDMFIAIPSVDKTFTCTLFAPATSFEALEKNPATINSFFQTHFPGAAELIGSDLETQFKKNPHLPLINIKCTPHHFSSSAVILGDAAHAMVPFYGQGMNAGLEDVRVLFSHLDAHADDIAGRTEALQAYGEERIPDAHTINDLALANYWEMHAGVRSPVYLLRKTVEEFLSDKMPWTGFSTQYSRVSFSTQRYSEVRDAVTRQGRILFNGAIVSLLIPLIATSVWFLARSRVVTRAQPTMLRRNGLGAFIDRLAKMFAK